MKKKERFKKILDYFKENMPVAETELHYKSPYELLVAVILSAQCTDKRVNIITPVFFRQFPTVKELSAGTKDMIFEIIRKELKLPEHGIKLCRDKKHPPSPPCLTGKY